MKLVLPSLLLAAVLLAGSGCAFMNDEDRDFYGKGWVKPADLDAPMVHHAINDPSRPQTASTSAPSAPAAEPAPQWLVPETAPQ